MFIFLERRNEELVHVAEDVLNKLEEDFLFKDYKFEVKWKKRTFWGKLIENSEGQGPMRVGILNRDVIKNSKYLHGTWLPVIQLSLIIMYVLFALFLFCFGRCH